MAKARKVARAAAGSKKTEALAALAAGTKAKSAAAERAELLLAEIGRRLERVREEFYDIGLALRELLKKRLHVALGYPSFSAMLGARELMSEAQAHKLIKLVAEVSRSQALEYGQEKALALIGYAEATPELDTPELLMKGGTLPSGKRVADASVREVKAARSEARKASGKASAKRSPEEVEAEREAKAAQAWLRGLGARKASAAAVKRDGAWWVRVELPASQSARVRGG